MKTLQTIQVMKGQDKRNINAADLAAWEKEGWKVPEKVQADPIQDQAPAAQAAIADQAGPQDPVQDPVQDQVAEIPRRGKARRRA